MAAFFALFDSAFGPGGSWPDWTGSVAPPVLCALAAPVLLLGYALQLHAVLPLLAVLNSACWAWAVVALVRWRRKKRP